jgi:hypothetical protein
METTARNRRGAGNPSVGVSEVSALLVSFIEMERIPRACQGPTPEPLS